MWFFVSFQLIYVCRNSFLYYLIVPLLRRYLLGIAVLSWFIILFMCCVSYGSCLQ